MTKDQLITNLYTNEKIKKYCKTICPNDFEELHSELIIQLYKMPWDKLLLASTSGYIEYLTFTVCKRILYGNISGSGIFYKRNKVIQIEDDIQSNWESDDSNDKIAHIYEIVEGTHWYYKILFKEYYQNGMKLREISAKYGINEKSIHYAIKKLRDQIKKKIQQDVEKS